MKSSSYLLAVTLISEFFISSELRAQVNDNCTNSTACLNAFNSGTGIGVNTSQIVADLSSSSAAAVDGINTTGAGVNGESTSGNGVVGYTSANTYGKAAGFFSTGAGSSSTAVAAENSSSGVGLYASSSSGYAGYFAGTTNVQGQFQVNGTCQFGCGSDERLKQNIAPLKGALNTLLQLKGVTFEYRNPEEQGKNATGSQTGFIAQEVEKAFPQWVGENSRGFKTLTIQPNQIVALEVESIRALKADNDELKARVKALEGARRPAISMNANGLGFGIGGLAIGGALLFGRRKREEKRS